MIFNIKNEKDLQNALNSLNDGDTLFFHEGIYKNKIKLTNNDIKIIGAHKTKTIITYDDYSTKTHIDNKEYNTFRTYTLLITGNNVTIQDITIQNLRSDSSLYSQAVSLHVLGNNFNAQNINILGGQDTLLCGPIPDDLTIRYKNFLPSDELNSNNYSKQFYKDCYICGDIDFIFGGGNSTFINCTINTINEKKISYVCAPSHKQGTDYGFTFIHCNFTSSSKNIKESTFLARPWRDFGYCTFICCKYASHIKKEGFDKWGDSNRDKTCIFEEYNEFYDLKNRVSFSRKLTKDDLSYYNLDKIEKNKF